MQTGSQLCVATNTANVPRSSSACTATTPSEPGSRWHRQVATRPGCFGHPGLRLRAMGRPHLCHPACPQRPCRRARQGLRRPCRSRRSGRSRAVSTRVHQRPGAARPYRQRSRPTTPAEPRRRPSAVAKRPSPQDRGRRSRRPRRRMGPRARGRQDQAARCQDRVAARAVPAPLAQRLRLPPWPSA